MPYRQHGARDVIDGHRVERRPSPVAVHQDHGRAAIPQRGQPLQVLADRGDQQPEHPLLVERVDVGSFPVLLLIGRTQQHREIVFAGAAFGGPGDVGEERVADVEHHQPDAARTAGL